MPAIASPLIPIVHDFIDALEILLRPWTACSLQLTPVPAQLPGRVCVFQRTNGTGI
jgi:hypothetical protein